MTDLECAWLAGLLEGEGCFSIRWRKNKDGTPRPLVTVLCSMTDEDVVRRIHTVAGVGYVWACTPPRREGWSQAFAWQTSRVEDVVALITALRPHMGARRQARIDELLEAVEGWERRVRQPEHGINGYRRGCRCRPCTVAHTDYVRERRRKAGTRPRVRGARWPEILRLLPASANEVAAGLGITTSRARACLREMQADGLVITAEPSRGQGKGAGKTRAVFAHRPSLSASA